MVKINMLVEELIKLLKKCPSKMKVMISTDDECAAVMNYNYPGLYSVIQLLDEYQAQDIKNMSIGNESFAECHRLIE